MTWMVVVMAKGSGQVSLGLCVCSGEHDPTEKMHPSRPAPLCLTQGGSMVCRYRQLSLAQAVCQVRVGADPNESKRCKY
uniref:uncharacterized protein LOC120884152 isoform X2 n=1 Tax=Ictidomys tridecemlineatus TaxID=43179 RepID=UPI001A9FDE41|nr:uncharacterized protein LOC120884152 isoform X2 [Ictidomys tridecemlineatus]